MSGWDRASPGYVADFLPQLAPYDADLASELGLRDGDRVLTTAGTEVVALARAVGDAGRVCVSGGRPEMIVLCKERARAAGLDARVVYEPSGERLGGAFDAAVSAFGLAEAADARAHLRALGAAIGPRGKVGVMTWGPVAEDDAERVFARAVDEVAPEVEATAMSLPAFDRAAITRLFEEAELAVVRHTVVSHAMVFPRAERFAAALLGARVYGEKLRALGQPRVAGVLARFYERVGGQDETVTYAPVATVVVAAHPGAEIELPNRPSVRVPI